MSASEKTTLSTITGTPIYKETSLTPFTGKSWSEIKSKGNYKVTSEKWLQGRKLILVETMPVRTWSICGFDQNNNQVSYEDYCGVWYEKRMHPVAGLIYYKDNGLNFMVKDLSKDGKTILSYKDSKNRVLVHDDSTNFVLYDPVSKTFIHNGTISSNLPYDKFLEFVSANSSLNNSIACSRAVHSFVRSLRTPVS